jgi:hypothetical protein
MINKHLFLTTLLFALFAGFFISKEPTLKDRINNHSQLPAIPATGSSDYDLFIPLLITNDPEASDLTATTPRVNVPYFEGDIHYPETAVFWFGRVSPSDNYADVRVGYNDDFLYINLAVFDRLLWYDPEPVPDKFTDWDAVSLYLNPSENETTTAGAFRFISMLNWWEGRGDFQTVYRGGSNGWQHTDLPFTTSAGWRGNVPNDNSRDDRGWTTTFRIPFSSLGLDDAPADGTVWKMGVILHDRDDPQGPPRSATSWPVAADPNMPASWGELRFGLPHFTAPQIPPVGEVIIRHKLNGIEVPGGAVGGGTVCGEGLSFWSEWGDTPSPGSESNSVFNVQNQADVADWPCFSRYYLTFPLDSIPSGKTILSAKLTLHQMGSSGGGDWGTPDPSYIQVFSVYDDWDPMNLTWNNAPLARENFPGAWVDPMIQELQWPGIAWEWDVSAVLLPAYLSGKPLRIALYSADSQYHSGKYFVSSYTGDWNYRARPSLKVIWGDR